MTNDDERGVERDPAPSGDETARLDEARITDIRESLSRVSTFRPGQLLAERYLVRRLVATGGMGEVYEVEDRDLGERVALKTLKAAAYPSQLTRDRFRREIQLSRRVTHPNVCRVHDSFTHVVTAPDGREIDELTCVTMELLDGETLTRKLEREGPLALDDALGLVRQMVEGLAAAHDAGIVHRDFKPGNVILVPAANGRTRAVITDFGLARRVDGEHDSTLTETGMVVGTPAYMPPEQLEGKAVTRATDIYALGVVMFEMVTGARPFAGETPISLAVQRLNTLPDSPATHRKGLDRAWEKTILRCLEPDPDARFADVRDVVRALENKPVGRGKGKARNRTVSQARLARLAVTALFVAALAVGVAGIRELAERSESWREAPAETAAVAVEPRRAAAVFGLKNLSGRPESEWLSSALAEMLRTEMAAGELIRLVSGEDIARAKVELGLSDADSFSPDTLGRLRESFGANLVMVGSYVLVPQSSGAELRVDIRLQDTNSGETVLAVGRSGSDQELLSLVADLGNEIRRHLGATALTADQGRALEASRPASREALRLYAEGLQALRSYDALEARDLLERAIALDPGFPMAHAALADAWATLGYDERALAAAKEALDLSGELDREQKMQLEARYHEASSNWNAAADVYGTLYSFYPDNLDYGLSLVQAETFNGSYQRCEALIAELRRLPGSMSSDPKIDLAEAALYRARGGFRQLAAVAEQAIRKGEERRAGLLVARAKLHLGWAFRELSRFDDAVRVLGEAKAFLEGVEDRGGAAEAEMLIGSVLYYAGKPDDAAVHFEAANAGCSKVGWKRCESHALASVGGLHYQNGQFEKAIEWYRKSRAVSTEIGDRAYGATTLGNVAQCLSLAGTPSAAIDPAREVLAEVDSTGQEYLRYVGEYGMGLAYLELGDLERAHQHFTRSLTASRENQSTRYEAFVLGRLGEIAAYRGDFEGARSQLREALDLQVASKETSTSVATRARLAEVSLWEGGSGDLAAPLERGVASLKGSGNLYLLAEVERVLADAFLAGGKVGRARETIDLARTDARDTESPQLRMMIDVTEARVLAAEGRAGEAVDLVTTVSEKARRANLNRVAWLADLERVRIAREDAGHGGDAVEEHESLIEAADRAGFGLLRAVLHPRPRAAGSR